MAWPKYIYIDSQNEFIHSFIRANIYCASPVCQAPPGSGDTVVNRHGIPQCLCHSGTHMLEGEQTLNKNLGEEIQGDECHGRKRGWVAGMDFEVWMTLKLGCEWHRGAIMAEVVRERSPGREQQVQKP